MGPDGAIPMALENMSGGNRLAIVVQIRPLMLRAPSIVLRKLVWYSYSVGAVLRIAAPTARIVFVRH